MNATGHAFCLQGGMYGLLFQQFAVDRDVSLDRMQHAVRSNPPTKGRSGTSEALPFMGRSMLGS